MTDADRAADFLRVMQAPVWAAAMHARRLEGMVANNPKLDEPTAAKQALTEADIECQETILRGLLDGFPDVCLEAEEDTPSVSRFPKSAEGRVVIDPIDGTLRSYLEGAGPYSVICGLALRDELAASLVALPREGLLFAGAKTRGAQVARAGGTLREVGLSRTGKRVLVSHSMSEAVSERLRALGFEPVTASGGAISVAPLIEGVCAGLRISHSATGISVRGRTGTLISAEAGASVVQGDGSPFPSDLVTFAERLIVARDPSQLDCFLDAIALG